MEKGVKNLDLLHHHLQTLYTLVYKCNADSRLTLTRLQAMSNLEVLTLMLNEPSGPEFVKIFTECVNPFLSRLSSLHPGVGEQLLTDFLVQLAKNDLEPCLLLFQQSPGQGAQESVFKSVKQTVTLALRVVYACERGDQLSMADGIVECLPITGPASGDLSDLGAQVDLLRVHLIALDTLQEYGVHKPVHYVKDIQNDPVEVQQLMIKLTRVANRRHPPLSESEWRKLLQNLLSLRSQVFTCVEISTCYKVFAESLLCSGQKTNISLASQLLTLSRGSHRRPPPTQRLPASSFNYRLSYEVSCELVLNATREYFNSAASLMDEDMDLARCCLDLFSSPTAAVQTEWNLIASMGLLDDFGVNILPLQVRLTENKLDIVRNVLDSSPTAYRDYEKITRLSRLLEGAGENGSAEDKSLTERTLIPSEGHSLILIILSALQKHDMKLAENLCQRLVEMKFAPAWEICRKVAIDSDSLSLATKMTLMNFCLTFCPPEEIECTISLRQNLQVQSLFSGCVEKTSVISTRGRGKLSGLADTSGATTVVKGLMDKGMQSIVKSAGAMQQLIKTRQSPEPPNKPLAEKSSEGFISIIAELSKIAESATSSPKQDIKITSHPFYSTRVSTPSNDTDGDGGADAAHYYGDWGMPGDVGVKLAVNQALLYAVQVANAMAAKKDKKMDCTKALLDLAEECSCVDTPLMLGYLFALPEADSADKLLSTFPKSKRSFELALFYLSLQIYVQFLPSFRPEEILSQQNPYTHSPAEVMNHVICQVMSCDSTTWPETLKPLLELLHKYQEKVNDLKEAEELLGLGLGIDTDQFESDSEYRHNIVLMLARTLSKKGFTIACKLAKRHHIPDWEVYMELLETLLTTSSLESHEVPRRIKDNNVMNVLLCNPQQTCCRLNDSTYEKLRGTNLTAMLSFYTALQQCLDKGATIETNIPVATHIRLLKKLKANVSGINYKALMSGEVNPLTTLSSALTDNNVHVVAKLADKIPIKDGGYMNADMVFRAYTEILFWKGDKRQQETDPNSSPKWVHRYEACQEFLLKLGVAEIRQFVKNIIFSDQSLKIGLSTRLELVKRSQRICQTRLKQEPMDTGFQELKAELEIGCKHLKVLTSTEFEDIATTFSIDEEKWEEYFTELDFSMSDPNKVHLLSLKMLTDSFPIELMQTVLSLTHSVSSNKLSVADLIREALEGCVQELSHDEPHRDSTGTAHIEKLEKIMASVSKHESKSGTLVSSKQLLEVLQPFCSNSSFSAHTRRTVLQLIEKYLYLSDEDVGLLLLYQTQSILSTDFSSEVTIENLSTDESRDNFFSQLLKEARSVDKVTKLFSLLEAWANSSSVPTQSWIGLLTAAAEMSAAVSIVPVIRAGLRNIPPQVDERLVELISKSSSSEALKLIFVSSSQDNIKSTIRSMVDISFPEDLNLLELIVITGSVAVIKTFHNSLYLQLCEYLQKSMTVENLNMHLFARYFQCSESELPKKLSLDCPSLRVKRVAQQLYEEGLVVDAGSLLLKLQDFHPTVSTLNGAVTFIRKLFSN
ncbi:NBAS subunit of NRZ tethering complex-like isoform X2 [Halichondria panicea]